MRNLQARGPASLEVCALLTKPERRKADIVCRYVGFEIPNRFAIGYGLDYGERYRSLPYVAALDESRNPGRSAVIGQVGQSAAADRTSAGCRNRRRPKRRIRLSQRDGGAT